MRIVDCPLHLVYGEQPEAGLLRLISEEVEYRIKVLCHYRKLRGPQLLGHCESVTVPRIAAETGHALELGGGHSTISGPRKGAAQSFKVIWTSIGWCSLTPRTASSI